MSKRPTRSYLDWNASAPLCVEARAAMLAALDVCGNPSSVHAEGRKARAIVEKAPFPAVMQWLSILDAQSGVKIVETRIEKTDAPGMVSVALVFQ